MFPTILRTVCNTIHASAPMPVARYHIDAYLSASALSVYIEGRLLLALSAQCTGQIIMAKVKIHVR